MVDSEARRSGRPLRFPAVHLFDLPPDRYICRSHRSIYDGKSAGQPSLHLVSLVAKGPIDRWVNNEIADYVII